MRSAEQQNTALVQEADQILNKFGLLKILQNYGQPYVTGSYALNLMTRRDLDINIKADDLTEPRFSMLRQDIVDAFQLQNAQYLNEFKDRHPRLPLGYYIGGSTNILGAGKEWELDIWSMDSKQVRSNKKMLQKLATSLNPGHRAIILKIKTECLKNSGYQHRFFSMDIYKAVLEEGITNTVDFLGWAEKYLRTDQAI